MITTGEEDFVSFEAFNGRFLSDSPLSGLPLPPQALMIKMISSQVSSHQCNPTAPSSRHGPGKDAHLNCNFFLTAIRMASLNQILDPWVYLLLREILLRKFCIVANAVSNCSIEDRNNTQVVLDPLKKQNREDDGLHKAQGS